MITDDQIELAALVAHEANRAYCGVLEGPDTQLPWDDAPEWQRESALDGVRYVVDNEYVNAVDMHANWLRQKEADGWVWGEEKDEGARTHPCMVEYHELPLWQRVKDELFMAVVKAVLEIH